MEAPILMVEEYWMNTHFSISRFYGGMKFNGYSYKIVNKNGITLAELSDPSSPYYVKDGKAIPAGEPADLVMEDWIPVYRAIGREKIFALINDGCSLKEAYAAAGLRYKKK